MSKIEKLKSILEKDDTIEGFSEFKRLLSEPSNYHLDDLNVLLRWAVKNQKKFFPQYYDLLVKQGANVNFVDLKDRRSNLMIACELKKEEIVETLANDEKTNFALEDSTNKTALFYAISNKAKASGEKYVRILLQKCPELVHLSLSQLHNPRKKNNPLEISISLMKVDIVKALLEFKANPNEIIDEKGNTPLHEAVRLLNNTKQKSHIQQIVQLLLDNGADPLKFNNQNKNAYALADKFLREFEEMCTKAQNKCKAKKDEPILVLNNNTQREQIFSDAEAIYKKHQHILEPTQPEVLEETGYDDDPFEKDIESLPSLEEEILLFAKKCQCDYEEAQQDLSHFLTFIHPIVQELNLEVQIYGSFSTGLWINQCDIDIMLIPMLHMEGRNPLWILDNFAQRLRGSPYEKVIVLRNIPIPTARVQIGDERALRKYRKFDIKVYNPSNNGRQHSQYVLNFMNMYPKIKPLFYIIKSLINCYKMYDPSKGGVRSFALFLMLAIYMQEQQNLDKNLTFYLLGFLYKYGYNCDYSFEYDGEREKMVLQLPDPINVKNNVGNLADASALQKIFKASYILLHTRGVIERLSYMFEGRELFM